MIPAAAHTLTRDQPRPIAVRAALLSRERPANLMDAVRHPTMLPLDRTSASAPAGELVLSGRLGDELQPGDLDEAVATQQLVELTGGLRPAEDALDHRAADLPGCRRN